MEYDKISFDNIKAEIESIFSLKTSDKWNLLPDDINKLAESVHIKLEWNKIDWWTSFEYGHFDVSSDQFFNTLFEQIKPSDSKVIIITDECFTDRFGYLINFKDLAEFADTTYSNVHEMDFFQPHDYIFVFPNDRLLTILHHSGYVMQFRNTT
jgi:hypothetical protein